MTEIVQVKSLALAPHKRNVRDFGSNGMKLFVAGTAIKFTMIINKISAVATMTISNPMMTLVVDNEGMTKEADYVYSYVYQTPSEDVYTGEWIITYRALDTDDNITTLSQDKLILVTKNI